MAAGTNKNGTKAGASAAADQPASSSGDIPAGSADKTISAVLGEIVWLMSQSPEFKQYLIADLEWLVMPPILLRQFKLFYDGEKPVAVVLFAKVSDEVAARLGAGAPTLRPGDWNCGETVKVVKVIAPFGGADTFAKDI